jgi:hypothetical protein
MAIEKESETVQRTKTTTYFVCDAADCGTRSEFLEDLHVVVNVPTQYRDAGFRPGQEAMTTDEKLILCDEHLRAASAALGDALGVDADALVKSE